MAPAWWERLPPAERAEYERSQAIGRVPLRWSPRFAEDLADIAAALRAGSRSQAEQAAGTLACRICEALGAPPVDVRVLGVRPRRGGSELHGLYTPAERRLDGRITLWMRTARRRDVVAIRTFVRTLLHEICHHLDFHIFHLPNSFHTPGFYRRESSLFRVVGRGTPLAVGRRAPLRSAREPGPATAAAPAEPIDGIALLRAAAEQIRSRSSRRSTPPRG